MRMLKILATAAGLALTAQLALAQGWPAKPVRFIVPYPPGGGTDGWTTTMIGTVATSDTGAKSFSGSQPSLGKNAGLVANDVAAISSV